MQKKILSFFLIFSLFMQASPPSGKAQENQSIKKHYSPTTGFYISELIPLALFALLVWEGIEEYKKIVSTKEITISFQELSMKLIEKFIFRKSKNTVVGDGKSDGEIARIVFVSRVSPWLVAPLLFSIPYWVHNRWYSPPAYRDSIENAILSLQHFEEPLFDEMLKTCFQQHKDLMEFLGSPKALKILERHILERTLKTSPLYKKIIPQEKINDLLATKDYSAFRYTKPYSEMRWSKVKKTIETILDYCRTLLDDERTLEPERNYAREVHKRYTFYRLIIEELHRIAIEKKQSSLI